MGPRGDSEPQHFGTEVVLPVVLIGRLMVQVPVGEDVRRRLPAKAPDAGTGSPSLLAVVHGNQVDESDLASMQQETHKSWAAIIAQENSDPDGANILHR